MPLEIIPEPDEHERMAIVAALEEEAGRPADSPWAEALRPIRGDDDRLGAEGAVLPPRD